MDNNGIAAGYRLEHSRTREDGGVHPSPSGKYTRFVCLIEGCKKPVGNYTMREGGAKANGAKHNRKYHWET